MADLTYKVAVDTAQAQQNINGLKSALGALAAAFSVRAVVQFGDSITNLQNRLRVLSPSTDAVNKQFAAIAQIADQSRAPLNAVGDLYFRIARSADQLGISQQQAAQITDSLAKGLVSSGMSAQEAAGPLLQLGQALQSGRFQGDELRSVLEGMPIVAKALADELGVPIGQLRKLGSEGKITGDVFVSAMQRAQGSINEAFNRTLPTVGQSIERLQTNLALLFTNLGGGEAINGLATAIGNMASAMQPLGQFIKDNGDALATLAKVAAGVTVAYLALGKGMALVARFGNFLAAGFLGQVSVLGAVKSALLGLVYGWANVVKNILRAIGVMTTAYGGLTSLGFAAAGLLRIFLRFTGIVGILYAVAEGVDFLLKKLNVNFSILGKLGEAWDWLKNKLFGSSEAQKEAAKSSENAIAALDDQAKAVKQVVAATAEQIYAIEALKQAYRDTAQAQEDQLRLSTELLGLGELQQELVNNLNTSYQNYLTQRKQLEKEILDATLKGTDEELARLPLLRQALADLEERYKANTRAVTDLTIANENRVRAINLETFALKQQQDTIDQLTKLQREMRDMGLSEIEKRYRAIEDAADDAAKQAIRAEEARRGGIKLSKEESDAYYAAARANNEALKRQTEELFEKSREFSTGWNSAFREYADNASNAAKRAESLFKKATQGMEDAIVNFAKTGKFEWRGFLASIAEELLRSNIQRLIAQIFGIGGGAGGGGGLLGFLLGGRASGGPVTANTPYMVGENGPEMFVPATSGQVLNQNQMPGMGGFNITYNINAVDAVSFQQLVARDPAFIFAVTEQGRLSLPQSRR